MARVMASDFAAVPGRHDRAEPAGRTRPPRPRADRRASAARYRPWPRPSGRRSPPCPPCATRPSDARRLEDALAHVLLAPPRGGMTSRCCFGDHDGVVAGPDGVREHVGPDGRGVRLEDLRGLAVHSFMIWCGDPAASTVTADTPGGTPRSAASGSHGLSSSSSATQNVNLPGGRGWSGRAAGHAAEHIDDEQAERAPDRGVGAAAVGEPLWVAFIPISRRSGR